LVTNRLKDINTHCLSEFRKHWECLEDKNQQLWQCRPEEWKLNKCVFDKIVRIPVFRPVMRGSASLGWKMVSTNKRLASREGHTRTVQDLDARPPSTTANLFRPCLYAGRGQAVRPGEGRFGEDDVMSWFWQWKMTWVAVREGLACVSR
jgi:hypothetical protein